MIVAVGIDAVDVARFAHWHAKSYTSLQRIFSPDEITYCLQNAQLSAQHFAVRFAAKEACAKILYSLVHPSTTSLLTVCRVVSIQKDATGRPHLIVDLSQLKTTVPLDIQKIQWHVSLTHTITTAVAVVIAEQRE